MLKKKIIQIKIFKKNKKILIKMEEELKENIKKINNDDECFSPLTEPGKTIITQLPDEAKSDENIINKKKRHEGKRHFILTEPLLEFRRFNGKLVEQNDKYGNFYGKSPYEAARKAANSIYESKILEGKFLMNNEKMLFGLKEITKDSLKKEYKYEMSRKFLNEPIEVKMKNGLTYQINFSTIIKSI